MIERQEIIQIIEEKRLRGFAFSTKDLAELLGKDQNTLECLEQVSAFGYVFSRRMRNEDCWYIKRQSIFKYRGQALFN